MHLLFHVAELDGGERDHDDHQDDRLRGGIAEQQVDEAVVVDLVDQRLGRLAGAAAGDRMDDAERVEEGVDVLMTSRKKVVGASSGKTMVQKRLVAPAPSIAAASISDFGIACSPATKNRKL